MGLSINGAAWGKIAGGVGLVVLLSTPYTFFITADGGGIALSKAGVGLALVAAYLGTNWKQFGQLASRRSTYYGVFSALTGLFLLGGLVAVNYVAWKKNKSWDLTSKKIHSLAAQSVSTLGRLEEPVQALAFLAPGDPDHEQVEHLLERYRKQAPEKFGYAFKDPLRHPDLVGRYGISGRPTVVLTRGEGAGQSQVSVHGFYEQDLTNGLIKLAAAGEQKAYFVVGHGQWPLEPDPSRPGHSLAQLRQSLTHEGYLCEPLNLAGLAELPKDASLVVVAGARTRLTDPEEEALIRYLGEGGRLLVFAEGQVEGGLERLLSLHGIQVDEGLLADTQFSSQSPYNVISVFYGEHEISDRHRRIPLNVQFPTARGLTLLREGQAEGVSARPVVLSSPYAWLETTPDARPTLDQGEKSGQIPMVAASQRHIPSSPTRRFDEARLVVFGDSEILIDANWGVEPNRNLVMNAFAWATTQAEKVTIRPVDRDLSTLQLEPKLLGRIHFVATDLLPVLLLGIGVAIWQARRSR